MDPVKDTLLISGCSAIAAPAVGPYPGITLITPAGKPASLLRAARYNAVKGVCSAGFKMSVQPKLVFIRLSENVLHVNYMNKLHICFQFINMIILLLYINLIYKTDRY